MKGPDVMGPQASPRVWFSFQSCAASRASLLCSRHEALRLNGLLFTSAYIWSTISSASERHVSGQALGMECRDLDGREEDLRMSFWMSRERSSSTAMLQATAACRSSFRHCRSNSSWVMSLYVWAGVRRPNGSLISNARLFSMAIHLERTMPAATSSSTLAVGLRGGLVLGFLARRCGGAPTCALTMSWRCGHALDRAWCPACLQRIHLNTQSHLLGTRWLPGHS